MPPSVEEDDGDDNDDDGDDNDWDVKDRSAHFFPLTPKVLPELKANQPHLQY